MDKDVEEEKVEKEREDGKVEKIEKRLKAE